VAWKAMPQNQTKSRCHTESLPLVYAPK